MEPTKQTRRIPSRDVDADLGRRAHMLMWDQRITNKQLAAMLGVDSTGLGKKLKGERGWALAEIVAIAEVLDTTVSYLVGEAEHPHPDNPGEGDGVPPTGIEPATYGTNVRRLAPVIPIRTDRAA